MSLCTYPQLKTAPVPSVLPSIAQCIVKYFYAVYYAATHSITNPRGSLSTCPRCFPATASSGAIIDTIVRDFVTFACNSSVPCTGLRRSSLKTVGDSRSMTSRREVTCQRMLIIWRLSLRKSCFVCVVPACILLDVRDTDREVETSRTL